MPSRPSEIPRRIFTITRIERAAYSSYLDDNPSLGLVFVDRERPLTADDVGALMRDETLQEMLGDFYVGGIFRWDPHGHQRWRAVDRYHHAPEGSEHGVVINQHNVCVPGATHAPDTALYTMLRGRLYSTTAHTLYTNCRELQRLIGCDTCPIDLDECMRRHAHLPLQQFNLPGLGAGDFQDLQSSTFLEKRRDQTLSLADIEDEWKHWKTQIGGFTYIPAALASHNAIMPGKHLYQPYELSFMDATLDGNRSDLSARSVQAAKTRKTKQTECAKCYFGGKYSSGVFPCDKWSPRYCDHLAWTEEQVIDETLSHFEHTLKTSGFTMRNFEQLLAIAGQTLYVDRLKYVIRGFGFDHVNPPVAKIRLLRVTPEDRGVSKDFKTLEDLWPHLKPTLRRIFDEAPTISRENLAVAAQMTCAKAIESYTCMAGCIRQVQPDISYVSARYPHLIEVGYWLRSYHRNRTVSSLRDVYTYLDCLPMFDIHRAAPEGVTDFRYCHWPR